MAERQHSDLVARRLAAIVDNSELLEGVDSHVEICIIDTGEGISPEFLPRSYGGDPSRLSDHLPKPVEPAELLAVVHSLATPRSRRSST